MEISELAKNLSVIIGALALISGIRAWKREYIGKRKIELAEETLMLFYQARDAIRGMRNPFGRTGEGCSRQKADNETEDETRLLNQAHVVFERYQKYEEVFNKLQSTRYRFMARFGNENEKPFVELNTVLNDIFLAAQMLGKHYWRMPRRQQIGQEKLENHLRELHKYEAIFWFKGKEHDEIGSRVDNIIKQIEEITRDTLTEKDFWFKNIFGKG